MTEVATGPGLLDLLRVVGGLVFVIGLALGSALLLRRSGLRLTRGRNLHVEERLALARGVQLAVVTCGTRRLLIGVSDRRVELVTELDAAEETSVAAEEQGATMPPLAAFATTLSDALSRRVADRKSA